MFTEKHSLDHTHSFSAALCSHTSSAVSLSLNVSISIDIFLKPVVSDGMTFTPRRARQAALASAIMIHFRDETATVLLRSVDVYVSIYVIMAVH